MAVTVDRTADIVSLQQFVRFSHDADVVAYLRQHPELVPVLRNAAMHIPEYFPENTTLRLQVLDDPDREEDTESHLYAVIESGLPLAEARSRLYRFDDEWWLRAFRDAGSLVSLVVE